MNKKIFGIRRGFTLAEVLITLGIIGVVAAMTIPTLIQNTNSVKFATQFKKDISTLSQAALMAQAQYDTDYASTTYKCGQIPKKGENATGNVAVGNETLSYGSASICGILNSTLAGKTYLGKGTDVKMASNSEQDYEWQAANMKTLKGLLGNMYVYSLADGSLVGVHENAKACSIEVGEEINANSFKAAGTDPETEPAGSLKNCIGFVDVNGTALPNKEVKCHGDDGEEATTKLDPSSPCTVTSKGSEIGDIFPIVFHDGTVEPASNAAKAVLTRGK